MTLSGRWAWLHNPWASIGLGLAFFPLAHVHWIGAYVFNFLTTLVHEIGHCLGAWLMGMPAFPTVSMLGGGVMVWREPLPLLCVVWMAAGGWAAWRLRERRFAAIVIASAVPIYAALAFTGAREFLPVAGGVLLEIGGAAACFVVVFGVGLERGFERPLYALWGWWMLLNRGTETVRMLADRSYWSRHTVIESGLAAGLVDDLEVIRTKLGLSNPTPMLVGVMVLCLAALPVAWWIARRMKGESAHNPAGPIRT